jgi:hypothetical protein
MVPFLAGESPLVSGNNIQFKLGAAVSPVSLNGTFETDWTPVAFFQLVGGASIGSGWNIPIANGLRMNTDDGTGNQVLSGGPFSGMVWFVRGGAAFQFDLAAVIPGEWNHVVFRTYHEAKYRALTSASSTDSWLYEADYGQNRNGWNYYGNYFIGYRMPIVLDTAGFLLETDKYLYDTADRNLWGDELLRWTFGPVFNFTVNKSVSVALLVQGRTGINFSAATKDYTFYQDRRVTDSGSKNYIEFYRVAVNVNIHLK